MRVPRTELSSNGWFLHVADADLQDVSEFLRELQQGQSAQQQLLHFAER